ncbi:uracil-xanthine permease family protein [Mailhella sp.]|uniref:uracil-xanthine permease family protein n=1 Tax=Mailhella sp. TaxID=1981029 RepID=UPI0040644B8F
MSREAASISNIYTLDGRVPLLRSVPFGLQHVLAMFVANIAPIMIVAGVCKLSPQDTASLIQTAMIVAGVGTLVQLFAVWRIGARLPLVMGVSFTFVSIFCFVGPKWGFGAVLGAAIVGGIIEGLLGFFAAYWRRIISPIVAACVVTGIGFSLLPVGANSFAGGFGAPDFGSVQNWVLGTFTLLSCIAFNIFAKGHLKPLAVLFGLVTGYILALFMGKVDLSLVSSAGLLSLPRFLPFEPEFNLSAIVSVSMIFLVSATETIGDTSAMTSTVLKRDASDREISGSLTCDGFVSSLSALFGCLPITSFSQNIGLLAMTKVVNRYTIATGAGIMLLAGIFPIVGALLASLPEAVLGGCTIMMFGNIVISGLMMIGNCGYSQRNVVIAALSLSVGLGFTQAPQMFAIFPDIVRTVFAENCVATVFIVAVLMNLVMPQEGGRKASM